MDFNFFESLTCEESQAFLERFIICEREAVESMHELSCKAGIFLDYQLDSLSHNLKWFLGMVRIKRIPVPENEPEWVRQFHKDGLVHFEEDSKSLVLRAAFYLGETFVRFNSKLSWAVGNPEFIQKNMPVVTGFQSGRELATIMVLENVFLRILGDAAPQLDIDRMVDTWCKAMP